MVKIGICDDNIAMSAEINRLIEKYSIATEISCKSYVQGTQLLSDIKNGEKPDIVFMDIELNGENGIDIAGKINAVDNAIRFIFITSFNQKYSQQIFLNNINLFGYIEKPIDEKIFEKNFSRVVKDAVSSSAAISVKVNGVAITIYVEKISYIESEGHYLHIHTGSNVIKTRRKLDDLQEYLPVCFIRTHKSLSVNADYISKFETLSVLLKTGQSLPVSRNMRKEAFTEYIKYCGGKLE